MILFCVFKKSLDNWAEDKFLGIFSTEELANSYILKQTHPRNYYLEEHLLNEI